MLLLTYKFFSCGSIDSICTCCLTLVHEEWSEGAWMGWWLHGYTCAGVSTIAASPVPPSFRLRLMQQVQGDGRR